MTGENKVETVLAADVPDSIQGDVSAVREALAAIDVRTTAIAKSYGLVRTDCEKSYAETLAAQAMQLEDVKEAAEKAAQEAKAEIAERDATIENLTKLNESKDAEIARLNARIEAFDSEQAKWRSSVDNLTEQVLRLSTK